MAYARIIQQYADGSTTTLQVGTCADGPDALDECVTRVRVLWHECCAEDAEDRIDGD